MFVYDICRFPIAIKTPQVADNQGIDLFVDEAKSMFEIGTYHERIVNLQGITYSWNSYEKRFSEVRRMIQCQDITPRNFTSSLIRLTN